MSKLLNLLCATSFAVCAADPPLILEGQTHHVQGIVVSGDRLYVTAVERAASKGWLFEYELSTGKRLRAIEIQQGVRFHPGGFDAAGDSLWIPVAEYRRDSSAVIQRRSRATLELLSSFEVKDHIGCLTWTGSRLIGGNWDTRKLYEWSPDGAQLRVRDNPNATRYQELKFRDGSLIGSGPGSIEWLSPETLSPTRALPIGRTDRNVPYTQEGFDLSNGTIYVLPEDAPSRLFRFRAN